jgi:hypothetical protein
MIWVAMVLSRQGTMVQNRTGIYTNGVYAWEGKSRRVGTTYDHVLSHETSKQDQT